MEINSTAITKRLADTEPGELIILRIGEHRAHCVVLGHERQDTVLGALETISRTGNPHPTHFQRSNTSQCVSYGLEWFIHPSPAAEFWAGNQTYRSTAGALYLEDNRWTVCFDTSDPRYDELHFDLTGSAICDGPSNVAAPVLN